MSICNHKYAIVDYFFNELSQNERRQLEHHLAGCPACQEHLEALAETSRLLKKYRREQPEQKLLRNYQRQLKTEFSKGERFSLQIGKIFEKFIRRPSIAIRLAEAVIFVLIGIFIGKTLIWQPVSIVESDELISLNSQPSLEQLILKNYLRETEMIFLDVANLDPVEDRELIFNLVQSAKYKYLLQKTLLLRSQAKELEDHQLSDVLSQIELILLELNNMEKSAYQETLFLIKQQLKDTHLLIEMKTLNQTDI